MSNDFGGKKRSELPDEVFGIPQERKYPMPDEKHTRSAIKLFNHVDPKYEEQLAKAIIKNMKKYNIDGSVVGPNNRLRKYLPKDMIQEDYIYETTIQDLDYQSNNKRFYDRTTVIDAINESNLFLKDKIITDNKLHDISAVIHSLESNQRKEFENMQIKNVYFYDIKYVNRIPVGFVLLRIKRIKNNEYFGTISIAVSPNYRHKGIATELLKKAISAYKKEKKITTLEWWAANDNTASNELCKKNGFVLYKSGDDGYNRYVYKEYTDIQESSRTSDFSYSGIKTSAEKSEFKRNFREIFKSDDDMEKLANTIITTIEPIVMTQTNKTRARNIGLVLKCSLENIDKNTVCVLILDGPQDKRDTDDARFILESIQYRIGNELYPMVTKITMGDGDEGCLYFTINTRSVKNIGETYMNDNTLQEETRIEDNKLPKHIYHISYVNHDGETFEPRTYDNDNVKNGMERKVKRVCFSDSVTRALYSIFPNGAYDADFYVHVPNSDCKVYKTTSDDIYDADITHELWIKEPVQMKCIGKIHVNGVSDKTHTIDVDKDKAGYGKKKYHETRWNWVEKYEKDETLYESYISEDDDMINEGGYIFTIKILPIALKSMFRTNQYDYKWMREKYLPKIVNKCSTVEEVAYLRRDANSAIGQLEAIKINIKGILDNDEKIISRLSPSFIKKVQQGKVTVKDVDEHIRFLKGPYKKMLNDKYKEIKNKSVKESSISEYGATAGTMVGSNQPDSVYIVNYMQNNVFSGYKEPRFGICKKGMKDLHVLGDKDKKLHHVSDRDKFKEEASDIKVYRYRGKPKHTFYDIIENTTDNDKDIYKLITGRDIENRKDIDLDEEFVREECFWDELDAIKSCTEATILDQAEDLHEIPILTETVQGRPYNYYRDINGVFVQNEITKIRSKSYDSIDDIPLSEIDIIKRGYLV